jgi:hypothetical protein
MTPQKSLEEIERAIDHKSIEKIKPILLTGIPTVIAATGFIYTVMESLEKIFPFITPFTRAIVTLVSVILGLTATLIVTYKIISKQIQKVKVTIHLDLDVLKKDQKEHIIDKEFRKFFPNGDISILQTWIPRAVPQLDVGKSRIDIWREHLQNAILKHGNKCKKLIHIRFLLLGSEEVLRNRIRYRWDVAKTQKKNNGYPLPESALENALNDAKQSIKKLHNILIEMEKEINKFLEGKDIQTRVRVSIRYYKVTPCGPIYIFGNNVLLAGFYDPRWTSDSAPTIRLENHKSAEWKSFSTQFEDIWNLNDTTRNFEWKCD